MKPHAELLISERVHHLLSSSVTNAKNKMQTGVEPSLAALPQPPVLLQPNKAALYHLALGHELEAVKFISLKNLNRHARTQYRVDSVGKWNSNAACIGKHAANPNARIPAALECLAIRDMSRRDGHRLRQSTRVYLNMALDGAELFTRVMAFDACRFIVLGALCVHDREHAESLALQFAPGRTHLIF